MTNEQKLREALQECAGNLESEIEARYAGVKEHPAIKHKYARDMEPVVKARSLLFQPPASDGALGATVAAVTNHVEALQLAYLKRDKSNLARCYIAIESRIREIHKLLKRGKDTEDHGVIGNLDCIYDSLTQVPSVLDDSVPPAATDGFVRVPMEPTQSMVDSGALSVSSRFRGDGGWCGFKEAEEFAVGSYRAMIAAAPQSGKKEDGWLPIDTAPTDGTDVLLWTAPWKTGAEGRYIEGEGWYLANVYPTDAYGEQIYPTHWMHLPPAPSTPSKKEDGQ